MGTLKLLFIVCCGCLFFAVGCDQKNADTPPTGGAGNLSSSFVDETQIPPLPEANTRPLFNPAASQLPLANDLIFSGSTDGTATVNDASSPVTRALNDLDGMSTTAQLDIDFQGAPIDPQSLCTLSDAFAIQQQIKANPGSVSSNHPCLVYGPNVLLIPLNIATDAIDLQNLNTTSPFLTNALPWVRAEVLSQSGGSGNVLRISPIQPLRPQTKYLVVLLDSIQDIHQKKIGPSVAYHQLGSDLDTALSTFQPLQKAIRAWESLGEAFIKNAIQNNLSKEKIVLSYTLTTTHPTRILKSIAAPATFHPALGQSAFASETPAPKPRASQFYKATLLGDGNPANPFNQLFRAPSVLYQGVIQLPSYLKTPSDVQGAATLVNNIWEPDLALGARLQQGLNSTTPIPPADKVVNDAKNPGYQDQAHNISYRYPFPKKQSDETIPVTVMAPSINHLQAVAALLGENSNAAKALNDFRTNQKWPVIIFAHGITVDRSASLILSNVLASACLSPSAPPGTRCFAVVTIDLPLHGISAQGATIALKQTDACNTLTQYASILDDMNQNPPTLDARFGTPRERHFGFTASAAFAPTPMDYINKKGSSGSLYVNLGSMQTTRDHLRQTVVDFLNLNASLIQFDLNQDGQNDLNENEVYFIGHSLGGLAGVPFVAVNNDPDVLKLNTHLKPIKAAAFLNTSGGIIKLIENSPNKDFGASRVLAGLALNSYDPQKNQYSLTQGSSNLEKYFYTFQATLDSTDPVNFTQALTAQKTPLLVTAFIGENSQTTAQKDQVIPVAADSQVYPSPYSASITAPYQHHLAGYCPFPDINAQTCPPLTFQEQHSKGVCLDGRPALPETTPFPAPLTGTETLSRLLGLSTLDSTKLGRELISNTEGLRLMVRFTRGNHGTPIVPIVPLPNQIIDNTPVFLEIATQISSFFSYNGQKIAAGFVAPDAIAR